MNMKKIYSSIPTSFASVSFFSTLFAACFFSFLYLRPDLTLDLDTHGGDNSLRIIHPIAPISIEEYHRGVDSLAKPNTPLTPKGGDGDQDGLGDPKKIKGDQEDEYKDIKDVERLLEEEEEEEGEGERSEKMVEEEAEEEKVVLDETMEAPNDDMDQEGDNNSTTLLVNGPLTSPENASREGRAAWFKERVLPRVKILESTNRSRWFDRRLNRFFFRGDHQDGHHGNGNSTTSCSVRLFMIWVGPTARFGKRELLTLESVFKAHPQGCVAIVSRTMDSSRGRSILEPLTSRGFAVQALTPDLPLLLETTPARAWLDDLKAGKVDPGYKVPITQNLSSLLRLVLLYRYGGVYLDFDMIILKDVSELRNSVGIHEVTNPGRVWATLGNAVLIFDKGHPLLLRLIEEFTARFEGDDWRANGPHLVTRVARMVAENNGSDSPRFNILSDMAFYPVELGQVNRMFARPKSERSVKWAADKLRLTKGWSYGVHLWGKASRGMKIEEGSIVADLIADHCISVCQDLYDIKASNNSTSTM